MQNELKVGQTFRVFEIISSVYGDGFVGKWTSEDNGKYYGSKYGIDSCFLTSKNKYRFHFGLGDRNHVKQVGLLRITRLK